MPRWRRRSDARPEEILDAALAEFTEKGFETARMEDIAKRAGLSKAGVYLYFESKEALLKALIEAKMTPIAEQASALAAAGAANPKAALSAFARVVVSRAADPKIIAVPRLVLSLSGQFPEIADHYRRHVVEIARAALEALIAAGVARGDFRAVDPKVAARAFIGPFFFEAMWTHILRGETAFNHPDALVEAQIDLLLKGLEAEPRA